MDSLCPVSHCAPSPLAYMNTKSKVITIFTIITNTYRARASFIGFYSRLETSSEIEPLEPNCCVWIQWFGTRLRR